MDAFIGEIRAFPYSFTPEGWFECDGSFISIAQYQVLFAVIGTFYGGNGRTNFQLPNFTSRSSAPVSSGLPPGGMNYITGDIGGWNGIVLNHLEMPVHNHVLTGATIAGAGLISKLENEPSSISYVSNLVVKTGATTGVPSKGYSNTTPANTTLADESISITGQNAAHNNMQPSLTMRYFINYDGFFPPRS